MKKLLGKPSEKEYWEERVKSAPNRKDMIFIDGRREEFWARVRNQVLDWMNYTVLDVCCGYGQFANCCHPERYTGIDFSEEMIKLAEKDNVDKRKFILADIKNFKTEQKFDVVFEVNSLHSLGWTPEQFYEHFKGNASKMVACLEADRFTIFQIYG